MNLAIAKALLLAVVMLVGKAQGTPFQAQAAALEKTAFAVVEQWAVSQDVQPIPAPAAPVLGDAAPLQVTLPSDQAPGQPEVAATSTSDVPAPETVTLANPEPTWPIEGITVLGSSVSSAGIQSDYACTMKTCHWDITQEAQLASWNFSSVDPSTMTELTIDVDPALQAYVAGIQVYVGSQLWTSADGTTWTGSAQLAPASERNVTVEATLLPGETGQFSSAVTIGGMEGVDNVTQVQL